MHNKEFLTFEPRSGTTHTEQLLDCLQQLKVKLEFYGLELKNILKQTIFFKTDDNNDYLRKKRNLLNPLLNFYNSEVPPTSFIAQLPYKNYQIVIEIILIKHLSGNIKLSNNTIEEAKYTVIDYGNFKEIICAGITVEISGNSFMDQANGAFELMQKILKKENLTFSNVVRQWNFIENILKTKKEEDKITQNYQVFNDVRSSYYDTCEFKFGYPAATGIGMSAGGVIIEFLATEHPGEVLILPISNPNQIDAHSYSRKALIGNSDKISTPKFERAKIVKISDSVIVFISGTAAISGQETITESDIEIQTERTILNIRNLISKENLSKYGIFTKPDLNSFSYLRSYVKNRTEIPKVIQVCNKYFAGVPSLYLSADICREDLLIEIEGAIFLTDPD